MNGFHDVIRPRHPGFGQVRFAPPIEYSEDATARDWVEATMRRNEVPSLVDLMKRPGAVKRLLGLLGA